MDQGPVRWKRVVRSVRSGCMFGVVGGDVDIGALGDIGKVGRCHDARLKRSSLGVFRNLVKWCHVVWSRIWVDLS